MSSFSSADKLYFEHLFNMETGYVLDFNDATYGQFFSQYNIDIHGQRYWKYGNSKAKKMRAFWESESDNLIGKVLSDMLDYYENLCRVQSRDVDEPNLREARTIVARLRGKQVDAGRQTSEHAFLTIEFETPNIEGMPIEGQLIPIIEARLSEVAAVFEAGGYLSTIILCGSILEAILLGSAQSHPKTYNSARATPCRNGSPKMFHEWKLVELINVASEVGIIKPDVKEFSHGLREFRNYIHPYQQLASRFTPDEHTARVCIQVLKAALASVAGER